VAVHSRGAQQILGDIYPKYDRLDLPLKPQSCSSTRALPSPPIPSLPLTPISPLLFRLSARERRGFQNNLRAVRREPRGTFIAYGGEIRRRKQRFPHGETYGSTDGKHECYAKAGENVRARGRIYGAVPAVSLVSFPASSADLAPPPSPIHSEA